MGVRKYEYYRLHHSTQNVPQVCLPAYIPHFHSPANSLILSRHLFFRTSYLLLANVTPIFIAEGETPELKFQVIAKRNEIQFMGARPRTGPVQDKKDPKGRTRFNHILKQCEELISCLGVQTLQPPGEAEAYGAFLNSLGVRCTAPGKTQETLANILLLSVGRRGDKPGFRLLCLRSPSCVSQLFRG